MTSTAAVQSIIDTLTAPSAAAMFNAATRDRWGNSSTRRDRRERLAAYQGNVCVKCGNEMTDAKEIEIAHTVPATFHGVTHAGFIWGNISAWHKSCNRIHGDVVCEVSEMARPDLIFIGTTRDLPLLAK